MSDENPGTVQMIDGLHSYICFCTPKKATIHMILRLDYTEWNNDGHDRNGLTSPFFPHKWKHQWRLYFLYTTSLMLVDTVSPLICEDVDFEIVVDDSQFHKFIWTGEDRREIRNLRGVITGVFPTRAVVVAMTFSLDGKYAPYFAEFIKSKDNTFKTQMKQALANMSFADVTLICDDGQRLPANKVILAARSQFFSSAFSNDFKEKASNEICVYFNSSVCKKLLEFMYSDTVTVEDFDEGQALLKAADFYLVEGLKNVAEKYLKKRLTSDNALSLLLLSFRHNAEILKKAALDILIEFPFEESEDEAYKEMMKHPNVVAALINHNRDK